jgi:cell pole-organizing protein PopZ
MSISIQAKNDYSYLFSSLSTSSSSSSSGLSSFLSDYASIKNGSYGKLMKAYYSSSASDEVKSAVSSTSSSSTSSTATGSLSKAETKAYTEVQSTSDDLKDSADTLLATGTKSIFNKKDITTKDENGVESTEKGYDTDAIYSAVSSFVKDYNAVVNAAASVDNTSISNRVTSMENTTSINSKSLGELGITINNDNTLSIDKETFKAADMDKAKSLFSGAGSYAYNVSASASMINYNADYALSKAATYTTNGSYTSAFSTGNLFSYYS